MEPTVVRMLELPESMLRDLFAGLALNAICLCRVADGGRTAEERAAEHAYRFADAMLAARKGK